MRSVSEVGFDLSVIKWKPITPEMFASRIDDASIALELMDEYGNGEIHVKSVSHGKDVITIYYIQKGSNSPIWRPFVMTWRMESKWLRFEYIG